MVPVAAIVTGMSFVFTFHLRCISVVSFFLYFKIFSTFFFITFLSTEIAVPINNYVHFSLSKIMRSDSLLRLVLSLFTFSFHNVVTLRPWRFLGNCGTFSYQRNFSNFTPISLQLKCSWAHILPCLCVLFFCKYWNAYITCSGFSSVVDIICICYLFLFVITSLHDVGL
jgi:hypothetical protein